MMQMVRWETAAIFLQLPCVGLGRFDAWDHAAIFWQFIGFQQITPPASRHDIFPCGAATFRPWYDMIKSQVLGLKFLAAILATKPITQKDIKPCKSRIRALLNVIFQGNYAGQAHRHAGRMNITVIFGDDCNLFNTTALIVSCQDHSDNGK